MRKTKRVVTFERRERSIVHSGSLRTTNWCERCGSQVLMLTPDEAAALSRITARAIFQRVEAGELHFIEEGGNLLVCINSLTPERPDV